MTQEIAGIAYQRKDEIGTLSLSGIIDIFEATKLHAAALEAFHDTAAKTVRVDASLAERLDSSALQILCALQQGLRGSDRSLAIQAERPGITSVLAMAGLKQ